MKASTAGVYGAGIENGKRKVKSEIRNSKSERSPNSENRIHDWQAAFGNSGFGCISLFVQVYLALINTLL